MASWMVHLRIADQLLDCLPGLSAVDFVVGNIAPDSGVPNEDWSAYTPSTEISHFRLDAANPKRIQIPLFVERYFTQEQRARYTPAQYSFFLGYLVHLMTDQLWSNQVVNGLKECFPAQWNADRTALINRAKEDWYDLDFRYLRQHPDFRAFRIYKNAEGYQNCFMSEFAPDAFDNRRQYITAFYLEENSHLDREYPYLSEGQMDRFVSDASAEILSRLHSEYEI